MENIDEDIKIVEELVCQKYSERLLNTLSMAKEEDEIYILTINERQAIENLLSRLKTAESENEISDQLIERQDMEIDDLKEKLKTAERMNDVLAEEMALHGICSGVEESDKCYANEIQCGKCIIEWARKKVEDD